jgi:hypothetical protein
MVSETIVNIKFLEVFLMEKSGTYWTSICAFKKLDSTDIIGYYTYFRKYCVVFELIGEYVATSYSILIYSGLIQLQF